MTAGDQAIGEGDGREAEFQLVKRYGSGLRDYVRAITKPVAGTVRLAVDGIEQAQGTAFHGRCGDGDRDFSAGTHPGQRAPR